MKINELSPIKSFDANGNPPCIDMPSIVYIQHSGTLIKLRTPQGDVYDLYARNESQFQTSRIALSS